MIRRGVLIAGLTLCVSACGSTEGTHDLATAAVDAMGGTDALRSVQNYVMREGTGSRTRMGQLGQEGAPDPTAKLSNVTETFDLANGRAGLEYDLLSPNGFSQHRQEILTTKGDNFIGLENVRGRPLAVMSPSGLFSWGTQNSPGMALRRSIVRIALAGAGAGSAEAARQKELDGRQYRFGNVSLDGEILGVYYDPDTRLIAAIEATDTETMLGDVPALYRFEDYRNVGGVQLPHTITITKDGQPYADVQFASASINDGAAMRVFEIPAEAAADADRVIASGEDYSPVQITRVAGNVHFAQAYSHHSLIVEFPSFLAVVEAPYTEAQTKTLMRLLEGQFPGKPVRYAAVTHPHFDHTGGVRAIAAQGATIVVADGHESQLRALLEAPHTNPLDALAARRSANQKAGGLEVFSGRKVITEGGQSLELHAISGSPHVDPMVLAYVPGTRVLFQSDLFFPGTGAGSTPAAVHLLQSVRALKLRVDTNAGGHGGVAPFAELVKAVDAAGTN